MVTRFFRIILIFLLFLPSCVLAQKREYILGSLLDTKTQEPIAFASIRIKDRALGVISNIDGSFRIPIKYKEYGDIIQISSMGYQTKEVLIHDFSIYDLNKVGLQPAILELEEAIVTAKQKKRKSLSARKIVRRAIESILMNYPTMPYSKVGYYRDYQFDDGEYVNLNEAILEVFDQGFQVIDTATTKTRIYDYVRNSQFRRDTLADNPYDYIKGSKIIRNAHLSGYGGNEFSILRVHDAIRNYQLNSFDFINGLESGDILKNHVFKKMPDTYFDDKPLYVIEFYRNKYGYFAKGTIYISKNNFAIHKLEYAVYDKTKIAKDEKFSKAGVKWQLIFECTAEYVQKERSKMYLNYISFHNIFQLLLPPKFTLKFLELNMQRRNFILTFSNSIDTNYAVNYKNFEGYFKGEKIKFERLAVIDNKILLFPELRTQKQLMMWQSLKIAVENNRLNGDIIDFNIKDIRDVDGNLINSQISKDYNQFREFFTQEIKLNPPLPNDRLFMNLRKPIFQDQPIVKPDKFDDYWMNTPLQEVND